VIELPDRTTDYYADPVGFWAGQGRYFVPFAEPSPEHQRQQEAIARVLDFPIGSIFEAGCGAGRLANFFRQLPVTAEATYTAIDVGSDQLAMSRAWRPDARLTLGRLQDHATDERYDLVVSSEVLMHIPPIDFGPCVEKLISLVAPHGRLLVVEWVPLPGELEANPTARHNWPHDYEAAFGDRKWSSVRTDRQMVYLVTP